MKNKLSPHEIGRICLPFITVISILTYSVFSLAAQVSPTAFAYPVSELIIDGDLSDWEEGMRSYKIEQYPYGNIHENEDDFKAEFRVAYNLEKQLLYLSLVIHDDSSVIDTTSEAGWDTQDAYTFYIDPDHDKKGSGVAFYTIVESLLDPSAVNVSWDNNMYDISWDHSLSKIGWKYFKIAKSRKDKALIYEMSIYLGDRIKHNGSIGLDHVIVDKDIDDETGANSYVSWGSEGGKSSSSRRLGNVFLLSTEDKLGTVKGEVMWEDTLFKTSSRLIQLTNLEHPDLWTITSTDSNFQYSIQLPYGQYQVSLANDIYEVKNSPVNSFSHNNGQTFNLNSDKQVRAPILVVKASPAPNVSVTKGVLHDFTDDQRDALNQFVSAYQKYYQIPGVSLALLKEGEVVYHKTYGVKNSFTQQPVIKETLFEAASITKPVFAYVVCRLAQRGVIDLDFPLYNYLPFDEIANDERYKLITARHVLSHQTGFPNWRWMNDDGQMNIKFTPGTDYGYSGEGFEYLKRVVEKVTGKDVQMLLDTELLVPMKLKNIYFQHNDHLAQVVANGHYNMIPTKTALPSEPGMAWSMHTEALSFSKFVFGLQKGVGLDKGMFKEMMQPQTKVPPTEDYQQDYPQHVGLGVFLEETPYGMSFAHGGNNGDFKCLFKMYPDVDLGFVVFTNSEYGDQLTAALEKYLIMGSQQPDILGSH